MSSRLVAGKYKYLNYMQYLNIFSNTAVYLSI